MRDIDFLPTWYPKIQRRYRSLIVQAWASLAVLIILGGYALARRWQVHIAQSATAQCQAQISQSQLQLAQLSEKMKFEAQLRQQDQIVARLGIGVDTTRLLKALEDAMTPEMGLTALSLETVEQPHVSLATLIPSRRSDDQLSDMDRRLKVVVDGVAPTDTESATFLARLMEVKCFENVTPVFMSPGHSRDGHITREFEVTFELDLNPPTEGRQ